MRAANLRDYSVDELRNLYEETVKEMFELKVTKSAGGKHPIRVRSLRRNLARIQTIMRERGL